MREERLGTCLFERVITWIAIASAGTSRLPINFASMEFSCPDQTLFRRDPPKSSRFLLPRRSKKISHRFRFVHQELRRPFLPTQPRMSPRFPSSRPLFLYRSLRSLTLRTPSTERTFSTLTPLQRKSVSLFRTGPRDCAPRSVGQVEKRFRLVLRGEEEGFFGLPSSPPSNYRR